MNKKIEVFRNVSLGFLIILAISSGIALYIATKNSYSIYFVLIPFLGIFARIFLFFYDNWNEENEIMITCSLIDGFLLVTVVPGILIWIQQKIIPESKYDLFIPLIFITFALFGSVLIRQGYRRFKDNLVKELSEDKKQKFVNSDKSYRELKAGLIILGITCFIGLLTWTSDRNTRLTLIFSCLVFSFLLFIYVIWRILIYFVDKYFK